MKKCIDTVKEIRRQYQKQWRASHKDRIAEYNRRYWEKKAAAQLAEQSNENHDSADN